MTFPTWDTWIETYIDTCIGGCMSYEEEDTCHMRGRTCDTVTPHGQMFIYTVTPHRQMFIYIYIYIHICKYIYIYNSYFDLACRKQEFANQTPKNKKKQKR
jgi:hypothetical protein